jgi:hypothetical protein
VSIGEEDLVAVYRQTIRPPYAFVSRRVGGDAGLAEDPVQDTWLRDRRPAALSAGQTEEDPGQAAAVPRRT